MCTPWIILVIPAAGLAVSASAQPVAQGTRQQIERLAATYEEHFNKQDATGLAGLYARNCVLVSQAAKAVNWKERPVTTAAFRALRGCRLSRKELSGRPGLTAVIMENPVSAGDKNVITGKAARGKSTSCRALAAGRN